MQIKHRIYATLIWVVITLGTYICEAKLTEASSQNLVTFFAIVFGFYMTTIAILSNGSYIKVLHDQIDKKKHRRGTHTLRTYLLCSGYWSLLSISSIIVFSMFATIGETGYLNIALGSIDIPWVGFAVDWNLFLRSGLFGISAVNIFFVILFLRLILNSMVAEARKK